MQRISPPMPPKSQPLAFRRLAYALVGSAALAAVMWTGVQAQGPSVVKEGDASRNFDARLAATVGFQAGRKDGQSAAVDALRGAIPDLAVTYDEKFGTTRSLMNQVGYLTLGDQGRNATDIALRYVTANADLLGLQAADVAEYETTDIVTTELIGTTHIYLRQLLQGLPVYNGQLQVNIADGGRILSVNNSFVPGLAASVNRMAPSITAAAAVRSAVDHLGGNVAAPQVLSTSSGIDKQTSLNPAGISLEPLKARLMLLPIQSGTVRLVWNFQIATLDAQHWYDFTVDADNGNVWTRFDWVASDQYTVYPRPVESPNHTSPLPPADGRTIQTNPSSVSASPFGWQDTNGVAGADSTLTLGNNVHAYEDIDANNLPPAAEVDCAISILCNFPIALGGAPSTYIPAAVTNLFYWNNIVHDVQYQYGFNSVGGNFQTNTYGLGGVGADAVRAEAQDGGGVNNANFATPPDGSAPRMQMYVWNITTPNRDGDLDSGIITHEYGHGISNRLVGGPANVSCLQNNQQPGEGLSDWWALVYTAKAGDTGPMGRGMGTYALGQPTNGLGIRTQRYSTDPAINTWTYSSINGMAIPHGVGSVWAQGAWEMYWALVNNYGWDANLYNAAGGAGNQRAMLYVNEGLKNTICSPAFTDVRDGIIAAAVASHSGEDVCRLWGAFASFGLGTNAVSGGPASTSPTDGFGLPLSCLGAAPAISISDTSVIEGNAATGPLASLNVSLSVPSAFPVTVNYSTTGGTASTSTLTNFFSNSAAITINDNAAATPYPSAITVPGTIFGPVTKVRATLVGLSHTFPGDIDIMLQGPTGQTVMLMSDAGENGVPVSSATITFDDDAPTGVPATVASGTFKPTNISGFGDDVFPAPAPPGPYGAVLSTFAGLNPAGQWKLFVRDDATLDVGSIATGWQIAITTQFSGGDYIFTSGSLTFPPGTTSKSIGVQIRGDATVESNEVINVSLTNPVNATIADSLGVITILDDDGASPPVGAGKADIAVDFGAAGLWNLYNGTTWGWIHGANVSQLAAGDLDGNGKADVIADFPGFGVWAYMNDTTWVQLHSLDVSGIATGDFDGNGKSDVLLNFPGFGVYMFANNSTWVQLHTSNPSLMITGDLDADGRSEAIMDFPGFGIYAWTNNSYWVQIHSLDVTTMAAGNIDGVAGDELLLSFPTYGLWMLRDNLYWSQLHGLTPTKLAIGDIDNNGQKDAIVNFTGFGVYVYKNNTSWVSLHPLNVSLMATADIDGNGRADVLLSFPGLGFWAWMNDTAFVPIHGLNPDAIAPANFNGN